MYYALLFANVTPGWLLNYPDSFDVYASSLKDAKEEFVNWIYEMRHVTDYDNLLCDVFKYDSAAERRQAAYDLKAGLGTEDGAHVYRLTLGPRGGIKVERV